MATTSNAVFTGSSSYSSDFQTVITRAVGIASMPLTQMQNQKATLIGESTALSSLDSKFSAIQNALSSIESAVGNGPSSYTNTVSNSTVATATLGTGVAEGSYTLVVSALGSPSSALSSGTPAVSDPAKQNLTTDDTVTLTLGTESATFAPGASLNDLATAINNSGLGVQATIVNVGDDYRLSVTSTKLGSNDITLTQSSDQTNLLGAATLGQAVSYSINGLSQPNGDSLSVSVAPGLTVNMLTTGSATITVSRDRSALANALQTFATSVNTAMSELDTHRGQGVGALNGDPLVEMLQSTLRNMVSSSDGSGVFHSLVDLGLTADSSGTLSFNQSAFNLVTNGKMDDVLSFLGSSTTSGFLKSATGTMNGLEDSTNGIIKTSISTVQAQMAEQDELMKTQQDSIDQLQKNLQDQYAASDAMIASLEQQASYYTNMFAAMQTAAKAMG